MSFWDVDSISWHVFQKWLFVLLGCLAFHVRKRMKTFSCRSSWFRLWVWLLIHLPEKHGRASKPIGAPWFSRCYRTMAPWCGSPLGGLQWRYFYPPTLINLDCLKCSCVSFQPRLQTSSRRLMIQQRPKMKAWWTRLGIRTTKWLLRHSVSCPYAGQLKYGSPKNRTRT